MKFTPIYYVCIACPTVEKTIEMVDKYVAHGATAFQIDMPSKNPFAETEFVKGMMKDSLSAEPDYSHYMDGFRKIREHHPKLELHIVVYDDVIDSIGTKEFCDFVQEVHAASILVPEITDEHREYAEKRGIQVFRMTPTLACATRSRVRSTAPAMRPGKRNMLSCVNVVLRATSTASSASKAVRSLPGSRKPVRAAQSSETF